MGEGEVVGPVVVGVSGRELVGVVVRPVVVVLTCVDEVPVAIEIRLGELPVAGLGESCPDLVAGRVVDLGSAAVPGALLGLGETVKAVKVVVHVKAAVDVVLYQGDVGVAVVGDVEVKEVQIRS